MPLDSPEWVTWLRDPAHELRLSRAARLVHGAPRGARRPGLLVRLPQARWRAAQGLPGPGRGVDAGAAGGGGVRPALLTIARPATRRARPPADQPAGGADQLRRPRARAGRGAAAAGDDAAADADRRRRRRQDAAGAGGGARRSRATIPTASGWSSWRRWPTRRSCPQAVAAALGVARAARPAARPRRWSPGWPAGACCWCWTTASTCSTPAPRWPRRCCAPAPACASWPPAASRCGIAGETAWRVPSLALPDAGPPPPPDALARFEAVRLFVERARAGAPGFAADGRQRAGGGRRSAGGWTASRWRSSWRRRGCGR